jgi:MerR family transcriptional regulator, heat shock protein HspR
MNTIKISVIQFSQYHEIEPQFVIDLYENGLVVLSKLDQEYFIEEDHLTQVEKYVRFHYDLGINLEGIEVIHRLLNEITTLQNRLKQIEK